MVEVDFDSLSEYDEDNDDLSLRHCEIIENLPKNAESPFFAFLHCGILHTRNVNSVFKEYDDFSESYFNDLEGNKKRYAKFFEEVEDYSTKIFSKIKEEDMLDFDFSETMARFKLISEMETRGMKGVFNGYGPTGKPKHYKFRTTHITRTKRRDQEATWEEQGAIKIPKLKEQDLLKDLPSACVDYDRFLKYL